MSNINTSRLIITLNELCKYLNNTYNINSGGCCYVSYLIAKHLELLDIPFEFVISNIDSKDKEAVYYEINNKEHNDNQEESVTGMHSCTHYFIKINDYYINGDKYADEDNYYIYTFDDIPSDVIYWIYINSDWNNEYSKNLNNIIRGYIKNFFKEYK